MAKRKRNNAQRKKKRNDTKKAKSDNSKGPANVAASSSSSSKSSTDASKADDQPDTSKIEETGNPVIKSPMDTNGYKIVRFPKTALNGLLVSTCVHPRDVDNQKTNTTCVYSKISEFNETHLNFKKRNPENKGDDQGRTTPAKKEMSYKYLKPTARKENKANSRPVKCRKGLLEHGDEMDNFSNNKCIGALYVKAGFHQDPPDIPGMAHLCEHVLTLGSKSYPEPEAFTNFVDANGGYFNAMTEHEYTAYYFYIDYKEITHALSMFADMFANPIYKKDDVLKERNNVDSEFEIKKWVDQVRHQCILKSCIPEGHPCTSFGFGSKESLTGTKELMPKVLEWIKKHYYGENMLFALQGPLPLPALEKLFSEFASNIPGRNEMSTITRPLTAVAPFPFEMKKWNQLYHIAQPTTLLSIYWALDPKYGKNYETNPVYYFDYILGHQEPGSLDWYLKQKGWITWMGVNNPESSFLSTEYYTMFSISMDLTSAGLDERSQVLRAVFLYIKLLQEKKASEEIFHEIRQLRSDIFHYRSDMNLSDPTLGRKFEERNACDTLVSFLHIMSKTKTAEDLLLSALVVRKFDAALLNEFINCLLPSRALVIFAGPNFEKAAKERERWCQTKYFTRPFDPKFLSDLQQRTLMKDLHFPKPNPYIAVSFCYPGENSKWEKMEKKLAYESAKGCVTYGNATCKRGLLPSAKYIIKFMSPVIEDDSDLMNTPSADVFVLLLKYVLDVKLGRVLSSLISYDLNLQPGAIQVILCGPSPKLPQLAKTILETVEKFEEEVENHSKILDDFKRVQIESYKMNMNELETCSQYLLDYIISPHYFFQSDYIAVLEGALDRDDFLVFVRNFKKRLFIRGKLSGCVSKTHADDVSHCIASICCKPYAYQKRAKNEAVHRMIELPLGERCLPISAKNRENGNVVVRNYYQVGCLDVDGDIMLSAIASYLGEAAFQELRTKQSLGYVADASIDVRGGIYGIYVCIQGAANNHTCGYIDERIDEFMQMAFDNCFASKANFKKNMEPLLNGETYKDTKDFYMTHLLPTGKMFRKLSIQIQGYHNQKSTPRQPDQVSKKVVKYSSGIKLVRCPGNATCGLSRYTTYLDMDLKGIQEENGYFITDVHKFKNGRPCFPILENFESDFSDGDE